KAPSIPLKQYAYQEARYTMLVRSDPAAAAELLGLAQEDVDRRWRIYADRAALSEGHPEISQEGVRAAVKTPAGNGDSA
ncbi:MAG TPA: hypothetical protein VMJ35_15665, partial [Dongiaceae bacterium]|nr:hypothetical protein [Dongiaceae bacterium]